MEKKRYRVGKVENEFPNENHWQQADVLTDFTFPWEDAPAPATEFRALWSDRQFFFRFDCEDPDIVLGEGRDAREKVLGSDRVEIFVASNPDLDVYYAFEMDPRGEVLAYSARHYRKMDWDWECDGLEVTGAIAEPGYRVWGSLSLETLCNLNVLRGEGREIIAGVYRAEFSHRADGTVREGWMPWIDPGTPEPDFHVPESFGVFELIPRIE